jgi:hypothetical protein
VDPKRERPQAVGADLIVPALAVGFIAYFFASIWDLAWEAKANGVVIGIALAATIAVLLARIGLGIAKGRMTLGAGPFFSPPGYTFQRLQLVAIAALFIFLLPTLGATLAVALMLAAAMWVLGVRSAKNLVLVSAGVAATVYVTFVLMIGSRIPQGPVERLIAAVAGLGG